MILVNFLLVWYVYICVLIWIAYNEVLSKINLVTKNLVKIGQKF